MQLRSEKASGFGAPAVITLGRKRRHFRHRIHSLVYVNLDYSNGGIIRNVSESGLAVQVVTPLEENQEVHLRFELLSPRTRVEATGRVVWTDSNGQAGLEFLSLAPRSKRQLKEWLFTQLLGTASQATTAGTVFLTDTSSHPSPESTISPEDPTVTEVEPMIESAAAFETETESPAWYPVPQSPRTLARVIDGLIVSAAVLLFCVVSLAMTHVFPTWPIGLALISGTAAVFGLVYWVLFVTWIGLTPGSHLAQVSSGILQDESDAEPEDTPRFR